MMNGIDTIIQRLNTDAKAETDALLEKARQEAAAVAARYQAQADKEVADLAARNERLAAEREERIISAAQMEARKTVLDVYKRQPCRASLHPVFSENKASAPDREAPPMKPPAKWRAANTATLVWTYGF